MHKPGDAGAFWRDVLSAGGHTAIPRWRSTAAPEHRAARHDVPIPAGLASTLVALAGELDVPLGSVLLAAHAKVLVALAGDRDVGTGYVARRGAAALPCRLGVGSGTWRTLITETHRAAAQLLLHSEYPVDDLRRALELPGPTSDVEFDATGDDSDTDTGTGSGTEAVLRVAALPGPVLRLHYRTDALDAAAADRIGGYYRTVLELIAAGPDIAHDAHSLLGAAERHTLLHELAGRHRDLPDAHVHELIEQRAHANPDAVAAVRGETSWTYAELNARANRLARALQARGLRDEDVVAVVTERTLDWLAAVLAILKAGGAYLPIEPHFPADRIARTLTRAGCTLVVTERGSDATLADAVATVDGVRTLFVADAAAEEHATDDLGTPIKPDQLAYIYFTSGSTGEPKGAMCEHAGMLNHIHAKLDDLGITAAQAVAQTAPQCFDISLWQLLAPLVAGGRTVLIEQEPGLEAERFVDRIVAAGVAVLQVVPSYLDVLLSHVEQQRRALPDLRRVSVTGEALKPELVQRWFRVCPGIPLVNAYGLTETSDDTNHEVLHAPPAGDRVPLGGCVANVRAYVVDEDLALLPLGAPGEIVFSGVCVGRGYVNDPERTRAAFGTDPYRPGERLYRSGDYGRWNPQGKLEYLGRRDGQVKIRGIRVEIGEIENALLRVPGVRDGAVVVVDGAGRSQHLAAWYSGERELAVAALRERLGESLPEFMVPAVWHWRESLPLTGNGKIDKRALRALAAELDAAGESGGTAEFHPPATATEQRLAAAWAAVLGIGEHQIDRRDSFFDRGGTSLSAVKLAVALQRAVSLPDITGNPVLTDLAGVLEARAPQAG